ncbi:MAG: NAD(P)-dependent oxidoreductase [Reichenbachiella sp.]
MLKIGILKEGKIPVDHRVAITPNQARDIQELYPEVNIVAQPSDIRCYKDLDYTDQGIELSENLHDCDVLIGVKEVNISDLIPNKTYFFFSHTTKKQDYNRELLRSILEKNITLIDYESLTNTQGVRIIAFGRWAGIVGAYNAFWAYGKRYNLYNIRRANECFDLDDLKSELQKIELPKIKIAITGGGRVAKGAMEIMIGIGVKQVTPDRFIHEEFDEPVYAQLNNRVYNIHQDGNEFNVAEFYKSPEKFKPAFKPYSHVADILVASAFWNPAAPVLFTREDATHSDFSIKLIADITCDIEGSIPSTLIATTIDEPVYDYEPTQGIMTDPFSNEGNITVMSVDNLPCELPRDASIDFGRQMLDNVIANLVGVDKDQTIERATIAKDGELTPRFSYLQDYVDDTSSEG